MLILIAGITGGLGTLLASTAIRRGQRVRGLGRSPDKLGPELAGSLESFVNSTAYYDVPALQKAVTGVDAVICAYGPTPQMYLEAQLLLLREAEKAGVKIFHAQTWNYNWHGLQFGEMEYYDANISFCRHVELNSRIRPIYVFGGSFAETLYGPGGPAGTKKGEDGSVIMKYWASDKTRFQWTSMQDCAEFSIEILLTEQDAINGKGGFFSFQSGCNTVKEFAEAYERVNGVSVELMSVGSEEDLERRVTELRRTTPPYNHLNYVQDIVKLLAVQGKWTVDNFRSFDHIKKTSIEDVVRNHGYTTIDRG